MLNLQGKKMKEGKKMSANLYSIPSLLVGKTYRSNSLVGEIVEAEKHPACVWYENAEAYLVRVRSEVGRYTYRTVAVRNND
jgi:hypothetical protein